MIQKGTIVRVLDNSGAKIAKCIKIYNKGGIGYIGTKILVSIIEVNNKNIKRGDLYKGKIITTRFGKRNNDNSKINMNINGIVLYKTTGGINDILPIANRYIIGTNM